MLGRLLFVLAAVLPLCLAVELQTCPYLHAPLPTGFRSNNCNADGCQVSVSGNIQFEIDAIPPYTSNYVIPSLVLVTGQDEEEGYDILVPIELPEGTGCEGLSGGCPVESDEEITWSIDWNWQPELTLVAVGDQVLIRFTLYDETETTIACFKLPVEIVA